MTRKTEAIICPNCKAVVSTRKLNVRNKDSMFVATCNCFNSYGFNKKDSLTNWRKTLEARQVMTINEQ